VHTRCAIFKPDRRKYGRNAFSNFSYKTTQNQKEKKRKKKCALNCTRFANAHRPAKNQILSHLWDCVRGLTIFENHAFCTSLKNGWDLSYRDLYHGTKARRDYNTAVVRGGFSGKITHLPSFRSRVRATTRGSRAPDTTSRAVLTPSYSTLRIAKSGRTNYARFSKAPCPQLLSLFCPPNSD
jgi:hypothetical protein